MNLLWAFISIFHHVLTSKNYIIQAGMRSSASGVWALCLRISAKRSQRLCLALPLRLTSGPVKRKCGEQPKPYKIISHWIQTASLITSISCVCVFHALFLRLEWSHLNLANPWTAPSTSPPAPGEHCVSHGQQPSQWISPCGPGNFAAQLLGFGGVFPPEPAESRREMVVEGSQAAAHSQLSWCK